MLSSSLSFFLCVCSCFCFLAFFTVFFSFPSSCLHENSRVVLLYVLEDQAVTLNKLKESFRELQRAASILQCASSLPKPFRNSESSCLNCCCVTVCVVWQFIFSTFLAVLFLCKVFSCVLYICMMDFVGFMANITLELLKSIKWWVLQQEFELISNYFMMMCES